MTILAFESSNTYQTTAVSCTTPTERADNILEIIVEDVMESEPVSELATAVIIQTRV